MAAKRRLGQNFLSDENVLRKIVDFIHPSSTENFLEIGAGAGALTKHLAPLAERLVAVEIDEDLLDRLKSIPRITVVHTDILKTDLSEYAKSKKLRVVGNLPYYISTPVLTALIRQQEWIQDLVLMFQEEVARRILAAPSTHEYSYLSVLCQYFCRIEKGFKISRNCFRPRPEVESRILRFEFQTKSACSYDQYSAFLSTAFSQRRKKLSGNLSHLPGIDSARLADAFQKAGIAENARAENLTPGQFESLLLDLNS